jgi:hypothetical protein
LAGFGIPQWILPVDENGNLKVADFARRLDDQRRAQADEKLVQRMSRANCIDYPSPRDVLMGKGKPYQDFSGNLRLWELIEDNRRLHQTSAKVNKTVLTHTIVNLVHQEKGRFLKRDESSSSGGGLQVGCWQEVDDVTARKKVSHAFRSKQPKGAVQMDEDASPNPLQHD